MTTQNETEKIKKLKVLVVDDREENRAAAQSYFATRPELEADFADELASVKGIGRNTVADIKRVFKSEEALIRALGKDKVPLRDDVVKALKKHYRIR